MKAERVFNFSPGPCTLPLEVLEQVKDDFLNFRGCGMGVVEMSHRGQYFATVFEESKAAIQKILNIPSNTHELLLSTGGGCSHFASIPMNFLTKEKSTADYIVTGTWSELAQEEGVLFGNANIAATSKHNQFTDIPSQSIWNLSENAAYLHYCDNETVHGLEFTKLVSRESVPDTLLIADMSSNFATRNVDWNNIDLAYGGAQKNLGPAGVTILVLRRDIAETKTQNRKHPCPSIMDYKNMIKYHSIQNTPPCFNIYMVGVMCEYMARVGSLDYWDQFSKEKSAIIYDLIDSTDGFYCAPVKKEFRSRINVRFNISYHQTHGKSSDIATLKKKDEELEKEFIAQSHAQGLVHLDGHRSIGGFRASIYNAMTMEGVKTLAQFMTDFMNKHTAKDLDV